LFTGTPVLFVKNSISEQRSAYKYVQLYVNMFKAAK